MTVVFDGAIGAVRTTSRYQSKLVLKVGEDCGSSRVSSRFASPGSRWHKWTVTAPRPMPPGYANFVILRIAATNPVSRNPREGATDTNVVDSAGNIWTRASDEILFEDGAPEHREVWYAIMEGALVPGDRITVKMPDGFSFDRAAAKASMWYGIFADGYAGADEYLSRFAARMMWWPGFETLLAHGINAEAIGRRIPLKLSIHAGDAICRNAVARAMVPNASRHDDVEAIVSALVLLNNARRQLPNSNPPPAAQIGIAA